jgi:oligo-alginate lyase
MFRIVLTFVLAVSSLTMYGQVPSLMMTNKDFEVREELAKREPWAAAILETLIHDADEFPSSYEERFGLTSVELPPEGGQWLHWYVCPETGTPLQFHPPNHNVCPDTGKEYSGRPFDQVPYQLRNDALHAAALKLGLAYRFTGDAKYAIKAASLLEAYADAYATWPLHDNNGKPSPNGARAYSQTLDESIWLIDLAWAYDLVRGSGQFTDAEKKHVEKDLLLASCDTISKAHREPTYNIQAWINGAIAAVGYTLRDPVLIHEAVDGPIGFRYQMHHFVQQGFWLEGSWGYQFYAMRPLTMTAQMAKLAGTDLWKEEPALLSLFQAPLGVVLPDGRLPAFNDTASTSLYDQDYLYERAYAASADSEYLRVLEHGGRTSLESLLFGVEHLPPSPVTSPGSQVFAEAGFATLRNTKNDFTIVTKFGPHGGAHGHFDKLGFVLYAQGRVLGVDPGNQLYGLPLHHEWDAMTVAHNTVSVDQERQSAATGRLLDWETGDNWTAVSMDAGPVYPDVDLQRTILLTPEYSLIIDHDTSLDGKPHTFDWTYHNFGKETLIAPFSLKPFRQFPKANGYGHLADSTSAQTSSEIDLRFDVVGDGRVHQTEARSNSGEATVRIPQQMPALPDPKSQIPATLHFSMAGAPATQLVTGTAPGPDLRVPVPFVLVRRVGIQEEFIATLAPGEDRKGGVPEETISVERLSSGEIIVQSAHFVDTIHTGNKFTYLRDRH